MKSKKVYITLEEKDDLLMKFYENNRTLRERVRDKTEEDYSFWANEYLKPIEKACMYHIDAYSYSYIKVKDNREEEFFAGCEKLKEWYDFFYQFEDFEAKISKARKLLESDEYEQEAYDIIKDLCDFIVDRLVKELDITKERYEEYYLNYTEMFLNKKMYYYENDYVLREMKEVSWN